MGASHHCSEFSLESDFCRKLFNKDDENVYKMCHVIDSICVTHFRRRKKRPKKGAKSIILGTKWGERPIVDCGLRIEAGVQGSGRLPPEDRIISPRAAPV